MPYHFHRCQGVRGRHIRSSLAHRTDGQLGLCQVIPALGPGLFKDAADDALDALVHGGMRARLRAKEKPWQSPTGAQPSPLICQSQR